MSTDRPVKNPLDTQAYTSQHPQAFYPPPAHPYSHHAPPGHAMYQPVTAAERKAESSWAKQIITGIIMLTTGTGAGVYGHGQYNDTERHNGGKITLQEAEILTLQTTVAELKAVSAKLDEKVVVLTAEITKLVAAREAEQRAEDRARRNR